MSEKRLSMKRRWDQRHVLWVVIKYMVTGRPQAHTFGYQSEAERDAAKR